CRIAGNGGAPTASRAGDGAVVRWCAAGRYQCRSATSGPGHHRPLRKSRLRFAAACRTAMARSTPMSSLRDDLDNYLQLRRHLGHDLADAARLLPRFVDYLENSGQTTVTVGQAVSWSMQPDVRPG